jgi:mRNA-degrading endonuclease toxin of MazEF toxin-antitoxin module
MKTRGDFDDWNVIKQEIEFSDRLLNFSEGEVRWMSIGLNVGHEIDGKGYGYYRPVLILKKYNKTTFLCVPLSTSLKPDRYKISIGKIKGKESIVNVSQIRCADSKRLANRICNLNPDIFRFVKRKTSQLNFD